MTLARDLVRPCSAVRVDDGARAAARLLVGERLPALLVVDRVGFPYAIVPAPQLLTALVQKSGEPELRPAVTTADRREKARGTLSGLSVGDWLPRLRATPGLVGPESSPLEVAALMARKDCPVAVIEREDASVSLLGAITADVLFEHFIGGP
ncbi:CBS domain-containing protein [Streptomyces sp. SLBN-8D4]|uniref:CBS domain-containing protein n=1 Tax=Streptomyces sp. SLBN-8D4 TaxID=3377728 RepID=UPI003C7BE8D1